MTIAEVREKCKIALAAIPRDMLVFAVIIGTSSASFGLGYLAGRDAGGQGSIRASATGQPAQAAAAEADPGQIVASKNGTKYYLPSCSGASRISEANKVWFASAAEAVEAGYAPAANCPGI